MVANYLGPDSFQILQHSLASLVAADVAKESLTPMIPRAVQVVHGTSFADWDAAMSHILQDLEKGNYEKVVLARKKRFRFHPECAPQPLDVLSALWRQSRYAAGSSGPARNTYMFCLQLEEGVAFLGNTPERLFRLDGGRILADALAGTVRRAEKGNEGDLLSELMGAKNLKEHAYVVDYITTTLANCGVRASTSGPHVRRLPRLMHLATQVQGSFPNDPAVVSGEEAKIEKEGRVFRLLMAMHPTPAVCGLPGEKAIAEIAKLEGFDRGFFAGPFGWFSKDSAEFCVAIRSALVHDCDVTTYAGCGIVIGSESKSEWDESELKLSPFSDLFWDMRKKVNDSTSECYLELLQPDRSDISGSGSIHSLVRPEGSNGATVVVPNLQCGTDPSLKDSTSPAASANELAITRGSNIPSSAESSDSVSSLVTASPKRPGKDLPVSFDTGELESVPNLNTLWGCCCVEELCRNGVDCFFVAPGSRSAPLAVGVGRSRHANAFVVHDERGAGFLAVGYARATGRAAVVITTSGTAVANLLPAVVEASMESLPMIILTADRPPELRDIGANQAIYQANIFGTYTRWAKDIPCPSEDIPLRNLLSDIDYAVHLSGSEGAGGNSRGYQCGGGPVHLNMMFREQLAPDVEPWNRNYIKGVGKKWQKSVNPLTTYGKLATVNARAYSIDDERKSDYRGRGSVISEIVSRTSGVIVLAGGSGCIRSPDEGLEACEIARILGWPIISDVCGGLRFDSLHEDLVIRYADQIFTSSVASQLFLADCVLQFGERLTSKRLCKFIKAASDSQEDFVHILVTGSSKRCDPLFTVTHQVRSTVSEFLEECAVVVENSKETRIANVGQFHTGGALWKNPLSKLITLTAQIDETMNQMMSRTPSGRLTEPWLARAILENVERPGALFIGNSMPIRDLDAFGGAAHDGLRLRVAANRGASGIDGIVSSGIGFGIGLDLDVTVVVGDMSMIHDLNALHLLREDDKNLAIRVTIVVVNNGGGGIFSLLPIAKHRDVFSPFFNTPHSLEFVKACEMFGLDYAAVNSLEELRSTFRKRGTARGHWLIEAFVPTDHEDNAALHRKLFSELAEQVSNVSRENS